MGVFLSKAVFGGYGQHQGISSPIPHRSKNHGFHRENRRKCLARRHEETKWEGKKFKRSEPFPLLFLRVSPSASPSAFGVFSFACPAVALQPFRPEFLIKNLSFPLFTSDD
jgi:hypothetical protein